MQFGWSHLAQVIAVALAMGLWFEVLPASILTDVGFLALFAAVLVRGYFNPIYTPLYPQFKRSGKNIYRDPAFVDHLHRGNGADVAAKAYRKTGYGFVPNRREWRIGLLHFLYFAAVGVPLALLLHAVSLSSTRKPIWLLAATFIGMLCVVSLSEEFLVRGVLQRWIEDWTGSRAGALLLASAIFEAAAPGDAACFPQLEMGAARRRARLVLRAGEEPSGQHPCQYGDPRSGGHHLASILRIAVQFRVYGKIRAF